MHRFQNSLATGKQAEKELDNWYSQWFEIIPVPMPLQRQGIDRLFKRDGKSFYVEYKFDEASKKTGNIFIETISVNYSNKPGWAIYSRADALVTYTPNVVYVTSMPFVKSMVKEWGSKYRTAPSFNEGYHSTGILVPVTEFGKYHLGNLEDVWERFIK